MNIEKVKEIKKGLEDNANCEHYNSLWYMDNCKCITVAYADILTLINELERENETIKLNIEETEKASFNINQMNGNLVFENQTLKYRIAELEKEVETRKEEVLHLQEYGKKLIRETELKQFAERLTEQMGVREYMGVKYKQGVFSENDIDETLKEYENDTI